MKHPSIIIIMLLLFGQASAFGQITITSANCKFAAPPQVDTFEVLPVTTPRPSVGADQVWDLSSATPQSQVFYNYFQPNKTDFPKASLGLYAVTSFSQLDYGYALQRGVEPTGFYEYGQQLSRQALPIGGLTGNPLDSVVFLQQAVKYAGAYRPYMFPLTMGTAWKDTFRLTVKFNLTVSAFGLNKVSGERRSVWTEDQSVVSWGSMTVRNAAGFKSAPQPVLCIRRTEIIRDSFFLAGQPAPAALLTAFGLQQGQISRVYEELYVRENESSPLCYASFSDQNFNKLVELATHNERVGGPTSSADGPAPAPSLRLAPNPVTTGQTLRLDLGEHTGDFRFELLDALGQTVLAQTVAGSAEVPTAGLCSGLYFCRLSDGAGRQSAFGRLVVTE